jgi:uncharacterized protein (DUF3820 family)
MYDLDTPLAFGKYRGRTVEDVLAEDPAYLLWAMETVEQFEVDKALQDAIERAAHP